MPLTWDPYAPATVAAAREAEEDEAEEAAGSTAEL